MEENITDLWTLFKPPRTCGSCGGTLTASSTFRPPLCRLCRLTAEMEAELDYLAGPPPHYGLFITWLGMAFLSLRHGENDPDNPDDDLRADLLGALERIFKRRAHHADLADILVVMHDHDRYKDMLFLDFLDWLPKRADAVRTGEARTPARGHPLHEELTLEPAEMDALERTATARTLRALRRLATPAQRRALRHRWRGITLDSADRNALHHLRRQPAARRLISGL